MPVSARIVAALAIALAACGRLGFDATGDGGSGIGVDNHNDGGSIGGDSGVIAIDAADTLGSGCVSPGIGDSFVETKPCTTWGSFIDLNSALGEGNGNLSITLMPNLQAEGGCTMLDVPFGPDGVFVQIVVVPAIGTLELVLDTTADSWAMRIVDNGMLELVQPGDAVPPVTPYEPWWRMRPLGGVVVYETSPDAVTWTIERIGTLPAPTTVVATFDESADDPAPGEAMLGGIDVCP